MSQFYAAGYSHASDPFEVAKVVHHPIHTDDNGPQAGGDSVSIIDARHCNARGVSRCQGPWPTITVGTRTPSDLPGGIAVDMKTDTVYVANVGADTVSVFNGATCNAADTSGCGQTPAEVPVRLQPLTLFADPANHTVYVTNYGAPALGGSPGDSTTVSMINSATCNATDLASGPDKPPPTVEVGAAPDDITVDQATHTVYVTTIGTHNGWSVFDANTCNATVRTGCAAIAYLPGDPIGPNGAEVDPANDTLYTANYDNTISAFSLRHCYAADLAGCATDKPGIVATPAPSFEHDLYVAVDTQLHSVYVTDQKDDALMVVDTRVCSGQHLTGCATVRPRTIHTGADPEGIVLDTHTQTRYTVDEVANTVSVIDTSRCSAQTTSGCRHPVPEAPIPAGGLVADPAVGTTYVASTANAVAMIDTNDCNALHSAGCGATAPTVTVGTDPDDVAVDPATDTVYVADQGAGSTGTVSVFDDRTCNATIQTGCATVSTLQVPGGNPDAVAVNPLTDTIYVATITSSGPNLISVFNGDTCNATDTTGCASQIPRPSPPATTAAGTRPSQ